MSSSRAHTAIAACIVSLSFTACSFAPRALDDERARSASFGAAYDTPFEQRDLPPLASAPTLDELWARVLAADGELEAAWREWRAELDLVVAESSGPNTNVALDLEHELRDTGLDAWNRTRIQAGFDPMQSLWGPKKLAAAGEIALARARTAGERFRGLRAAKKRALIETWIEWVALVEERATLLKSRELRELELATLTSAAAGGSAGAQIHTARARVTQLRDAQERALARSDELAIELNGLLRRGALETLEPPPSWPARSIDPGNLELERLLALARERDPARAAVSAERSMRERDVEAARLERRIDVNPFAGIVGSLETFVGASLSLPLNRQRLRAVLDAARERRAGARALERDVAITRDAQLALAHRAWREAERARALLATELLPLARAASDYARARIAGGSGSSAEWVDARDTEMELARAEVQARAARELALARIEEHLGIDLESVGAGSANEGGLR